MRVADFVCRPQIVGCVHSSSVKHICGRVFEGSSKIYCCPGRSQRDISGDLRVLPTRRSSGEWHGGYLRLRDVGSSGVVSFSVDFWDCR